MLLKALATWFVLLVLAVVNGALRESLLVPALGAFGGLMLSGVILALLVLAVAWLAMPWFGRRSPRSFWLAGTLWLVLTLAFEFAFGRLQHKSWEELLQAYAFTGGNLWPAVLLVVLVAPRWMAALRGFDRT